jgi:UDP-N-acetylmuramoyl-tripeptide--D-alanyl-D-alanine ligase
MTLFKKLLVGILTLESLLIIRKYKPFVVAITGSVGKTSTKDAIYGLLSREGGSASPRPFRFVRKSEKSLNSEIGLPLAIIGRSNAWHSLSGWGKNVLAGLRLVFSEDDYPDCLVLEIGVDHPGDIRRVVRWLRPDIAVLTKISDTPVHVEFFASPAKVFEEKAALAKAVKRGGALVVYADDEKAASLAERAKDRNISVVSYGMNEEATAKGSDMSVIYEGRPVGMSFNLHLDDIVAPISVRGILGRSCTYPLLSAAAVGKVCGIAPDKIALSLSAYEAPKSRMNVLPGLNGSTLIDDSYNSSPDAAMAALETLKGLECSGAKIAILGDMMELGKYSAEEHRKIGAEAASTALRLITVGQRSRLTAEEAVKSGMLAESVRSFDSSAEAAAYAASIARAGDIILVKGSQSVRMERVSKALLREPERASELLVRQEKEWLEKP